MLITDKNYLLKELKLLFKNGYRSADCQAITNSAFYKKMQTEWVLEFGFPIQDIEIVLLIAQIAAASPILKTVKIGGYNLEKHGSSFTKVLSTSLTITEIGLNDNNLGKYAVATVEALENLKSLSSLNINGNKIKEYGPITAEAASKLANLKHVAMSKNELGEYGPETAKHLAKSTSLKSVVFNSNGLNTYGEKTAEAPMSSKYIEKIEFISNELGVNGLKVAQIFMQNPGKLNLKVRMFDNDLNVAEEATIKSEVIATNATVKQLMHDTMASFLWANNKIELDHELHLPKEIACHIAGQQIDPPSIEIAF